MARVKIGNKTIIKGVVSLELVESKTQEEAFDIIGYYMNNGLVKETIKKSEYIRIEVLSRVMQLAKVGNCATVIGNVHNAKVGNSLNVEGFITDYKCPRGSITVDRQIKVCYGAEDKKRHDATGFERKRPRAKVIRIEGDLLNISIAIHNVELEPVFLNDVSCIEVGNCLNVKGNVKNCEVENMISATMGKSKAPSTAELVNRRKQADKEFHEAFSDLFNNIKK